MTDEEINEAAGKFIDFNFVFKRALALFDIEYANVDHDGDLILNKLDYVFTKMPTATDEEAKEQERIKLEIQALKLANTNFMQYLREPRNRFPEMSVSPLRKVDEKLGVPHEYFELLEEAKQALQKQASFNEGVQE